MDDNELEPPYSLKLITGPTVWVATPSDVRNWGQRPSNDTSEDDLILDRIKSATELVEPFSDRILLSQTWEMRFDRFYDVIRLVMGPWQSITSVKYYSTAGTLTTMDSSDYLFDDASGRLTPAVNESWPATQNRIAAVQVRFLSGFGAAATSVPALFKDAVILTVLDWLENRHGRFEIPAGVKEKLMAVHPGTL